MCPQVTAVVSSLVIIIPIPTTQCSNSYQTNSTKLNKPFYLWTLRLCGCSSFLFEHFPVLVSTPPLLPHDLLWPMRFEQKGYMQILGRSVNGSACFAIPVFLYLCGYRNICFPGSTAHREGKQCFFGLVPT